MQQPLWTQRISEKQTYNINTFKKPCSKMKPRIIGTAVNIPIWNRNCAFRAALRASFCSIPALT